MGVSYFNCEICEDIVCDAGDFGICSECESYMCENCHNQMLNKFGRVAEDSKKADNFGINAPLACECCSGELVTESDIISYLLKKINKPRHEIEDEIRRAKKVNNNGAAL